MINSITIPVAELKPALAGLAKVISRRTTLPVLSCIKVERTRTGAVELAVTDLDSSAVLRLNTLAPGEPFAFLVPFEDLGNVAKSCGRDDNLVIAPAEQERVSIRFPVGGQTIEHRCDSLPAAEFPAIPEIGGKPVPLGVEVRRAIHEALDCASTDQTRLILNGAYLDVSQPKAHYVVGTDGHHLFASNSFALPMNDSLVIPSHRFLGWKEFNQDGEWNLRVATPKKDEDAPQQFEIASEHWRFIARSINGNYPNWRHVLPGEGSANTTLEIAPDETDSLIQTIGRLPNHDTVNHTIGIEVRDGRLHLLAKSAPTDPWTRVEIAGVRITGGGVTIFLNRQLLIKALRFRLTRIEIVDPLSPLRFSAGGRQMIVMPTRDTSPRPAAPAASAAPAPQPTDAPSGAEAAGTPSPASPQTAPPTAEPTEEQPMPKTRPETTGTQNGGASHSASTTTATTTTAAAEKPALDTAIAQIETIKGSYREAIRGLNDLGDLLRQAQRDQKASDKEVQSVRQTLRSLQGVRI